jgi:transcriptional regulator with XRE-family HTH domain
MGLVQQARLAHRLPQPALARAIRVSAHVTQEQVAHELGVHAVTVGRWELGVCEPRGEVRARYAALLGALRSEIEADLNAH